MRTLWRKSFRDLKGARWQVLGLSILVAISVALALGALRAKRMLADSLSACLEQLHAADLEIRCSPTFPGGIEELAEVPGILAAEERMLFDGQLRAEGRPSSAARVQFLPPDHRPDIFALSVLEGRWPEPGEEAVLLDRSVRTVRGIGVGATITLEILGTSRDLPVVGITLGSEHALFPVHPDFEVPIPGALAVVHASAATAKHFRFADRVDSLLFRFEDGADPNTVQAALLAATDVAVMGILTPQEDPSQRVGRNMLHIYGIYMPTAVGVLLTIALALYLIILARLVHMQRRFFGTLFSIGERRTAVAVSLLPLSLVPTLLGCALGVLGHAEVARSIVQSHETSLGWAPRIDSGMGTEVPLAVLAALALAVVGCLLPALATASRPPTELLRPDARRFLQRRSGWLGVLGRNVSDLLHLPMSVLLGLRTVFRRRWVTAITALALGANFALVMAFLFVHLSHSVESEEAFQRLGLTGVAYFSEPQSEEALRAAAPPDWTRLEPNICGVTWIRFPDGGAFSHLACLEPDGWISRYEVAEGRPFGTGSKDSIHIDYWLADQHGVAVGDRIVAYPSYSSPEGKELQVAGIFGGVSLGIAAIPLETGRELFDLPGMATGLQVETAQPREEAVAALQALPQVQAVVYLDDARRHIAATFAGARFIISLSLFLAVLMAVVFLGILASLDTAERARDLAVLRALGWRDRTILGLCVTEVSARGFLALLLALPTAPLLATWMLERIRESNRYRMPMHDPTWIYLMVTGIALALIPLGALPALRAARALPTSRVVRLLGSE